MTMKVTTANMLGMGMLSQMIIVIYIFLQLCGHVHGLQLQRTTMFDENKINRPIVGSMMDAHDVMNFNTNRRGMFHTLFSAAFAAIVTVPSPSFSCASTYAPNSASPLPFVYSDSWTGTRLKIMTLNDATTSGAFSRDISNDSVRYLWTMGKWPDPALRIPAKPLDPAMWLAGPSSTEGQQLKFAASILRDTARKEGAVGLAAQQCGVDVRMIYLSYSSGSDRFGTGDMVLINPRIVARSPESNMKVWTEECLVLPPTFRATVLRDEWIDVEYDFSYDYRASTRIKTQSQEGVPSPTMSSTIISSGGLSQTSMRRRFFGEQSRCLQHELDHDRGILITDHVGMDELENDSMRMIEAEGHDRRQTLAYSRE